MPAAATHIKSVPTRPEELESLFRAHYDRVFRTAYRVTGSLGDAEDVLQTVFLRLVQRTDLDLSPSPESYLSRAAVNASLDLLRKRSRSRAVPLDDVVAEQLASPGRSPEAHQVDLETRKIIRQAISQLGERAAEVFILRYIEGYDNGEIARLIGSSQLVVAVMLHRARTRLRKEIGKLLEGNNETHR